MDGIIDSMDISLSKLQEIVKGRGAWHAEAHRVERSRTQLSNLSTTKIIKMGGAFLYLKSLQRASVATSQVRKLTKTG